MPESNTLFVSNLTIADGQVAVTPTKVVSGFSQANRLNLTFANVGGQQETLTLTLSRNGGPQRRLKQVVLDANEQFEVCGLPLNSTDVLYAQTTDAASVDYLVSIAAADAPLTMHSYDSAGRLRTAPYILEQLDAVTS